MPDCRYCDASFDDESAYHAHLESEHPDELGPIDRRRLRGKESDGGSDGSLFRTAVLWTVLVLPVLAVGYVLLVPGSLGGGPTGGPHSLGSVHEHGTMTVVIDGERIDFSKPRYQVGNTHVDAFHFENGNGRVWHVHAKNVTLQWALDTLGIHVTENAVRFDGRTYRESDPNTTVTITVNGEPVDPSEYVLQGAPRAANAERGDRVRVVVNVTGG